MTTAKASRGGARAKRPAAAAPPPPADATPAEAGRRAEALAAGFVTVEQCGVTMRIPVGENVPLESYLAFRRGDEMGGTEKLLGDEQWKAFLAAKPTLADFAAVGRKLREASGN